MNFDVAVGDQANSSARNVTCIEDAELVTRAAVETLVTQFERLVIERRRVVPPGNAPALVSKIDERRSEKGGIILKTRSAEQMRLAQQIAQVVVETAGAGVGPGDDGLDALQALSFGRQFANRGKLGFQPNAVVQRHIDVVQVRSAVHGDGFVKWHAQLHADTVVERLRQLENARSPVG